MRGVVARRRTVHFGWVYGYYARARTGSRNVWRSGPGCLRRRSRRRS
jgi:hypothetical protein